MKIPCRGIFCDHLQCFSLEGIFQQFKKQQKNTSLEVQFNCPICKQFIPYIIYDKHIAGICNQITENHMKYVEITLGIKGQLEINKFRIKNKSADDLKKKETKLNEEKSRKEMISFYKDIKICQLPSKVGKFVLEKMNQHKDLSLLQMTKQTDQDINIILDYLKAYIQRTQFVLKIKQSNKLKDLGTAKKNPSKEKSQKEIARCDKFFDKIESQDVKSIGSRIFMMIKKIQLNKQQKIKKKQMQEEEVSKQEKNSQGDKDEDKDEVTELKLISYNDIKISKNKEEIQNQIQPVQIINKETAEQEQINYQKIPSQKELQNSENIPTQPNSTQTRQHNHQQMQQTQQLPQKINPPASQQFSIFSNHHNQNPVQPTQLLPQNPAPLQQIFSSPEEFFKKQQAGQLGEMKKEFAANIDQLPNAVRSNKQNNNNNTPSTYINNGTATRTTAFISKVYLPKQPKYTKEAYKQFNDSSRYVRDKRTTKSKPIPRQPPQKNTLPKMNLLFPKISNVLTETGFMDWEDKLPQSQANMHGQQQNKRARRRQTVQNISSIEPPLRKKIL